MFLLSLLLCIFPDVELLDHMIILCFIFGGITITFPIVATLFYIPNNSVQGFRFLHIPANACYFLYFLFVCYLKNRHPNMYGALSHCSLIDISGGDIHQI